MDYDIVSTPERVTFRTLEDGDYFITEGNHLYRKIAVSKEKAIAYYVTGNRLMYDVNPTWFVHKVKQTSAAEFKIL